MSSWRLIDLDGLEPLEAQTFYEAVAVALNRHLAPNTLILCYPKSPYVCIGFHQELEKEVDVDFCKKNNLPIIRRSQGGGAVYLDSGQLFYQIVAKRYNKIIPASIEEFFEKILQVPVYTYRKLGIPAKIKPINDVVVGNRKISGNGAGELDEAIILVGNIILDIDYESMARVLKVPNAKFRDKLVKSIMDWVSSLHRELGYTPPREDIKRLLIEGFEQIGIKLIPGKLSTEEKRIFEDEVKPKHLSKNWLYLPEWRHSELMDNRTIKITGGVKIVEAVFKAKKMIRVTAEIANDVIKEILISGDFFMMPESALQKLEASLVGTPLQREELLKRISDFYKESNVQVPGIEPIDFVEAIMRVD